MRGDRGARHDEWRALGQRVATWGHHGRPGDCEVPRTRREGGRRRRPGVEEKLEGDSGNWQQGGGLCPSQRRWRPPPTSPPPWLTLSLWSRGSAQRRFFPRAVRACGLMCAAGGPSRSGGWRPGRALGQKRAGCQVAAFGCGRIPDFSSGIPRGPERKPRRPGARAQRRPPRGAPRMRRGEAGGGAGAGPGRAGAGPGRSLKYSAQTDFGLFCFLQHPQGLESNVWS